MSGENKTKQELTGKLHESHHLVANLKWKISQHKQTEQTLQESERQFRTLIESLPIAVVIYEGTKFLYTNPAFEKITGYSRDEVYQHDVWQTVHPDYKEIVREYVQRRLQGEPVPEVYTFKIITKSGEERWVERSAIDFELNKKSLVLITGTDITKRKQAEEALRKSEERYRRIAENMSDMVSDVDAEGLFSYVSPSHQRILGYRPEDLLGTAAFDKFHPDDKDRVASIYMQGVSTKTDSEAEYRYRHADGHYVWLRSSGHIILDGTGKYLGSIISSSDITKRKQLEDNLEYLVQERTTELSQSNKQLTEEITERKEAEAALKKKADELKIQSQKLQELNATLKVLLKQREEDRTELEEKVLSNVKHLLFPQLETLREQKLDAKGKMHLDILEGNLKNIVSPFSHRLSSKYMDLTPTEIRVANLIRQGKTTKEISKFLGSSDSAINIHRFHIRRKLGLIGKNINLQSHLSSIS